MRLLGVDEEPLKMGYYKQLGGVAFAKTKTWVEGEVALKELTFFAGGWGAASRSFPELFSDHFSCGSLPFFCYADPFSVRH